MSRSGCAGAQTPPLMSSGGGGRLAVLALAADGEQMMGSSFGSPTAKAGEKEADLAAEPIEGLTMMNPNNSEQPDNDIPGFFGGAPTQDFHEGWNPGLHPSAQPYPYFYGFQQHPSTGFMPFPVQPSSPAAPAQNQTSPPPAVETEMCSGPAVMKESQCDGAGGSVPTGRRCKVAASRIKLSNFSPKEDVFLVKSWLEISHDPIINTGKKRDGFWSRIMSRYSKKRGPYPERSIKSLQSRWDHIKVEGVKFAAYVASVLRENPSGMSAADKTSLAQANFADVEQYPFAYMHCWDLLKDEPKWMEIIHKGPRHGDDNPSTGLMPLPVQPSSPAAPAQNQTSLPAVETEMCPGPAVMKENQGDGAGGSVPTGRRRKVVVSRIKLSNFSPEEDVFLVKSRLEISCDPIINTGQKRDGFWSRIMSRYNEKRGPYPERSIRSLQSRWEHIKAEGVKFAAHVANVLRENPSGMSDVDKTSLALANFYDVEQYPFVYMHCWDLLKDEPKWMEINHKGPRHCDDDPSTGFMPSPVQPSSPAAPAQNHTSTLPAVGTEMCPGPAVIKESQGDGAGGSLVVASHSKLSNFSPREDVFLVKSWLEISCDPITNMGQKRDGFWSRIMSRYNEKRGPYPERSIRSLQSRWELIKAEGGKFAAFVANVLHDNPSGMSDTDKTSLAQANFADVEQYPFAYMHCWDLLKDEPKWMEINHKGPRHGDDDVIRDYIPPTSNTIDLDPEIPPPNSPGAKRPMGRDATKAAAKKSASSSASASSSQNTSKLQDPSLQRIAIWQENMKRGSRYERIAAIEEKLYDEMRKHNESMYNLEQQKVQLMREKLEMQRLKEEKLEEERILGINLDNCPPPLRMYYQAKQEEILQKIEAGCRNNSGQ